LLSSTIEGADLAEMVPVEFILAVNSFHEKAGVSQVCFFFLAVALFGLSRAASVAILPSALFVERFSLGASWASSFQ
jgi:hypothetical protein